MFWRPLLALAVAAPLCVLGYATKYPFTFGWIGGAVWALLAENRWPLWLALMERPRSLIVIKTIGAIYFALAAVCFFVIGAELMYADESLRGGIFAAFGAAFLVLFLATVSE